MERMSKLRRSLRDSFRKKRSESSESSKPHQWQADEEAVRSGLCSFRVKYLGCVEVFESRGMPVCEEAMKVLRQSRRRPVKSILFISGDGLRVVEDETKGLIVDQTIEKVSFCAPDRNHDRGFSYICRDGTTRRWMCHGFLSSKDSNLNGERLSHAVGCAFAACLERKQKREKECGVSMTFDPKTSTFTRSGSFRVSSLTNTAIPPSDNIGEIVKASSNITPNPHAIERPHAPVGLLERQGSFRGFSTLANQSPFKRQLSLRLNELPSNLLRTQGNANPNTSSPSSSSSSNSSHNGLSANSSPAPPIRTTRSRLHSLPNNSLGGGIVESNGGSISSVKEESGSNLMRLDSKDLVTELCQQVTQGLSLLAANHDDVKNVSGVPPLPPPQFPTKFAHNPWSDAPGFLPNLDKNTPTARANFNTPSTTVDNSWIQNIPGQFVVKTSSGVKSWGSSTTTSSTPAPISSLKIKENVPFTPQIGSNSQENPKFTPQIGSNIQENVKFTPVIPQNAKFTPIVQVPSNAKFTPGAEFKSLEIREEGDSVGEKFEKVGNLRENNSIKRAPLVSSMSVARGSLVGGKNIGAGGRSHSLGADPFNADWATEVASAGQTPNNPFARSSQHQTFQISM